MEDDEKSLALLQAAVRSAFEGPLQEAALE